MGVAEFDEFKARGNAASKAQRYDEAIKWYKAALKNAPPDSSRPIADARHPKAAVHSNLSLMFLKLAQYKKALEEADACIAFAADWSKGHFRKAEVLRHVGQYADAQACYQRATSADPSDESIWPYLTSIETLAKLAGSPVVQATAFEQQLGIPIPLLWPARGGAVGFLLSLVLLWSGAFDAQNGVLAFMSAVSFVMLGAAGGFVAEQLMSSQRSHQLQSPAERRNEEQADADVATGQTQPESKAASAKGSGSAKHRKTKFAKPPGAK